MTDLSVHINKLAGLVNERSDKLYAWPRWLVVLSAGFFALMAGQLAGRTFSPLPLLLLKTSLTLTAAGILFGAIALYGEVHAFRKMVVAYEQWIRSRQAAHADADAFDDPPSGKPSLLSRRCEPLCYVCLLAALLVSLAWVLSV